MRPRVPVFRRRLFLGTGLGEKSLAHLSRSEHDSEEHEEADNGEQWLMLVEDDRQYKQGDSKKR